MRLLTEKNNRTMVEAVSDDSLDSANDVAGYSHVETYPIIADLITEINQERRQWAKRSDLKIGLTKNVASSKLIARATKLSRKSPEWTAGNMIDFWSKDMTQRKNPYLERFSRSRIDDETAYWDLNLGDPQFGELRIDSVVETESEQYAFTMEKYLEKFLVDNWQLLDVGKYYDIIPNSQNKLSQYTIGRHRLDIFAKSKDSKKYLVIELKRGRTGDETVGQILRYIGAVREKIAINDEEIFGLIVAEKKDDDLLLALKTVDHVDFRTYEIEFNLKDSPSDKGWFSKIIV